MTFLFCSRDLRARVGIPSVARTTCCPGARQSVLARTGSCLYTIAFIAISLPAFAQTPPPGPVQFPAGYTTNAPASTPSPIPSTVTPASQVTSPAPAASTTNTAEDIHDIRGPISIPYQWLWAAYIVGGLVIAAFLFALWRWFRGRVKIKTRQPFEIALDRLEAARALMNEAHVREYAFAVSEIIRSYIEQRFGEKAKRRTTEEFLSDLIRQTGTPLAAHRALLEDFLNHCDLPKFARWQLSIAEMESMHASARTFILETRPQIEPVTPAKAAAPTQPELVPAK